MADHSAAPPASGSAGTRTYGDRRRAAWPRARAAAVRPSGSSPGGRTTDTLEDRASPASSGSAPAPTRNTTGEDSRPPRPIIGGLPPGGSTRPGQARQRERRADQELHVPVGGEPGPARVLTAE